ncbi:uncharacterized protein JCM6883_001269 [Sporobolomyces salmoneus]|uniref:uncharacterized protein n=1 Tax=Sporobolomyces salmoneus TaxID=183962 RepID=UPI00317BB46E
MDRIEHPSTPTRQTHSSSSSNLARNPGEAILKDLLAQASQSTPASVSGRESKPPEEHHPSFNTSSSSGAGDGSIILHSLSDQTAGTSGIESSFEALQLSREDEPGSTNSSLEIIVHSSPINTGSFLPPSHLSRSSSGGVLDSSQSRRSSLVAIEEGKALVGNLSPSAQYFALPTPARVSSSSRMDTFEQIVALGKDEYGQLTPKAKEALARLGLKPVPSLHGPLNLPYARCASGIDAIVISDDAEGEQPWGDDDHDDSRPQRTLPLPLPGNSRYSQAGRLAMRYSSAPGALESGNNNKRSNHVFLSPPKSRKPSSSSTRPPPSASLSQSQPRPPRQEAPSTQAQQIPQGGTNQLGMDPQAFARARAMQAFFLQQQQAQLAQALGGGQGQTPMDYLSVSQAGSLGGGLRRSQSPYLPPFQPFSPPISSNSLPSVSQAQQQSYFAPTSSAGHVDPLTLLRLAGQQQLGLNPLGFPSFPPPQVHLSQTPSINFESDFDQLEYEDEPLGGRQAEEEFYNDYRDFDRSAVQYENIGNPNSSGRTGYDFLRASGPSSQEQQRRTSGGGGGGGKKKGNNNNHRRNSSSTQIIQDDQQSRTHLSKPPQETRRRRSAGPTVPYPGHSHRNTSTSSVVTVNSTLSGPVPSLRIFSDPSPPPLASTSSSQRRRSNISPTSTGRPFEDLANAQTILVEGASDKKSSSAVTSPAEISSNWRRPSLPTDEILAEQQQQQVPDPTSPSSAPNEPSSSSTTLHGRIQHPRGGRGRGTRGRKRGGGNRGSSGSKSTGSIGRQNDPSPNA